MSDPRTAFDGSFDSSGWIVATSGSQMHDVSATGGTKTSAPNLSGGGQTAAPGSSLGPGAATVGAGLGSGLGLGGIDQQTMLIGAGLLLVVLLMRKRKA